MFTLSVLRPRLRAAAIHLVLSAAVAACAALLVFVLWYPGDYRLMSGGIALFLLVAGVDLVLGPVLTFTVFDLRKGWPHLRRDLAVIAALQVGALVYGIHTVYVARPVAVVFEIDRIRIVSAIDVLTSELDQAPPAYRRLPLTGPWLLSARRAQDGDESREAVFLALGGFDTSQRPSFWRPYESARTEALAKSRPAAVLLERYPERKAEMVRRMTAMPADVSSLRFLPVIARGEWVAILDASGTLLGFLPVDGFF